MEPSRFRRHFLTLQESCGPNLRLASQQQRNYLQKKLTENSLQRERIIQLIHEEIFLEVTAELCEEISSHVIEASTMAARMSRDFLITCAIQGTANNNPQNKERLASIWRQHKSERDKSGNKVWIHSQKLTRYEP